MDIEYKQDMIGGTMKIFSDSAAPHLITFPQEQYVDLDIKYSGSSPYHVTYCGYEQVTPGASFGPAVRNSCLLHIVMKGKGVYCNDGKTYSIHQGQVFLIRPDVETVYKADQEDPWMYGWIGFKGHRVERMLEQMGFTEDRLVLDVSNSEDLFQVILNMMTLHKMTLSNEMYRTAELLRFFGLVMENLEHEHPEILTYKGETYAQAAMKYMNENYMKKIKISDLASYIGIERSYLTHIFTETYHKSPQQYLMQVRMEKARDLLKNTEMHISEVAAQAGYSDALAFSRIFRKETGKSPSEYREAEKMQK